MHQTPEAAPIADRHILLLATFASLLSTAIAILCASGSNPPPGTSIDDSAAALGVFVVGWVAAQSFVLTLPGIAAALLMQRYSPRTAVWVGTLLIITTPGLMLVDAITFHWIGERFLSAAVWRAGTILRDGLLGHATAGMIASGILLLLSGAATLVAMCWAADRLAIRWALKRSLPGPGVALIGCLSLAGLLAAPSLVQFDGTRNEMAQHSSRHPFCVIGLISFHNSGRIVPAAKQLASENPLKQAVLTRDHQQRQLGVDRTALPDRSLPDVLIVVVESFRHELVDPQVMPNLSRYAELGIHCRSHFSGGNATNHGMFSLLNGLEAIWYERPVRYSPLLNRVFRQAGYELGFFAGHDDWRKFYMDGYISDEHFDVFETSSPGGLASDRRATQLASDFLNRDETSEHRRPRLALLYLYATHATYNSYVEDQVFQPAADDRFLIPYPQAARPQIWNRYKNSARSVDRLLSAVLRQDRVVVVTGDHGESFLEDGTIGHGIRISAFQNKTPAVLFIPGQPGRVIEAPTSHADLLPTILSATGVPLSDDGVFDGVDLLEASDEVLSGRLLVTRNYLRDDVALIGPWTNRADQPFGYRVSVSLRDMHMSALNCIDQRGYQQESAGGTEIGEVLKQWSDQRFGTYLTTEVISGSARND